MRVPAVLLMVALLMGCVLPRPNHRKALVVDAVAVGAGAGLIGYNAWDCRDAGPCGCHVHSTSMAAVFGPVLFISGLLGALITHHISRPAKK
jgi:hypothetical protein